jgi:L-fuculose-phosphate aldolase
MNAQVTLPELQRRMVGVARALHTRAWVANHEGNATALTADGRLLATPGGASLGDVREGDLLLLDRFGRKVSGAGEPFAELPMHLAVFRGRPDVGAVVHAHPPVATAFACAGLPVEARFLPEFIVEIGGIVPLVPFALPGSEALAQGLADFLEPFDAVLLANHGVLAWGPDLATALRRIEHVEAAATILRDARALGGAQPLPDELVLLLEDARTQAGLGPSGRARARARTAG